MKVAQSCPTLCDQARVLESVAVPFSRGSFQPRDRMQPQLVKNPPVMWETWVRSQGWEDPLEKAMATHSGILAWRIPWTVQSVGSLRVGLD